jgi:hypothetical protein
VDLIGHILAVPSILQHSAVGRVGGNDVRQYLAYQLLLQHIPVQLHVALDRVSPYNLHTIRVLLKETNILG